MRKLLPAVCIAFTFSTTVFASKNLADHPLQIQVIESHWNRPITAVDRR
jgi:hypothetical protein